MKRVLVLISIVLTVNIFAQNLYFDAYKNIQKAKRMLNSNPAKANRLFIVAYGYLKQVVNDSIDKNKPSVNSFKLLGEMYLYGWGVEKNPEQARKLLCAAKLLGNAKAAKIIKKQGFTCPAKLNYKELKQ